MCRLFQRLQPGSKWIEASRSILLASQEIKVTSELQKLPDQQTKEVWHPFFPPTTVHQVFKSYRRVQSSNQVHLSLIKKLILVANASKGDIKVITLWLYRVLWWSHLLHVLLINLHVVSWAWLLHDSLANFVILIYLLEVACLNGKIQNLNYTCMSLLWALCFGKRGSTTTGSTLLSNNGTWHMPHMSCCLQS